MEMYNYKDKFRVIVEHKIEDIEKIEKQLTQMNQKKEQEEQYKQTEEYKKKQAEDKEAYRRRWILEYFKELHPEQRDMTEEEYKEYISILEDEGTKKSYSILSFINKENPHLNLDDEQENI